MNVVGGHLPWHPQDKEGGPSSRVYNSPIARILVKKDKGFDPTLRASTFWIVDTTSRIRIFSCYYYLRRDKRACHGNQCIASAHIARIFIDQPVYNTAKAYGSDFGIAGSMNGEVSRM